MTFKAKVNADMGRRPTKKPSFFKVLLDGFANHLQIPHKFTKNHIPLSLGRCVLSGPCGKRSVELQRRKNGLFFHKHGWHCFVKDHLLQFGYFLIFRYNGKKKFKVKIYDRTCCEIDVEAPKKRNGLLTALVKKEIVEDQAERYSIDRENADKRRRNNYLSKMRLKIEDGEETSTRTIIFKSEYPCFKVNLTARCSKYRLPVPKIIVVSQRLESKKTLDVEDSTGRLWPVMLVIRPSGKQLGMSTGWGDCSKANNIVIGDVVAFEFVEEAFLRLHVFRKGSDNRDIYVVLDAPNVKKKC